MSMPVPTVSEAPGPGWATNLDACLSIIDSHTHTSGQGVPITPEAIDINDDLPMNGNNLTTARSVRFSPQSGTISNPTDLGCLYENGVDLYYVDGAGNQVRITQGGSVTGATGTITGLPSGTASASFAAGTFTFQSATNTPATMNIGPIVLGQAVASGKNVTVTANGSQAANYNLVLPLALPSVQSGIVSDASGNTSFLPLQSTTYTPTLAAVSGGDTFAVAGPFMVAQVGNTISVSGRVTFNPTAQQTLWTMTLPISRTDGNFSQTYQANGLANGIKSGGVFFGGHVVSVASSQTVQCQVASTSGDTGGTCFVQFTYYLTNIQVKPND